MFTTAVPPPGVHPELALATSMSWADKLEPAAFCGSDAAFPVHWREGDWYTDPSSRPALPRPIAQAAS